MPEAPNHKLREIPDPPGEVAAAREAYAELDVSTNFSFLRGASHPDELVFRAAELGYRAIAVTDRNSLAGAVRMHEAAKQAGVKLLVGARLCFVDGPDVLAWVSDRGAYGRLCRLLTLGKRRAKKGECELRVSDLLERCEGMFLALVPPEGRETGWAAGLGALKEAAGDRLSLAGSCFYGGADRRRLAALAEVGRMWGVPLLATNQVHYHAPCRRALQDVLVCIRHTCTIAEGGRRLFPNGERYLKSPGQMHRLFADHPQAVRRVMEIVEGCHFSLDELRYEYPHELIPAGWSPIEHLADLTWKGAVSRYPRGTREKVREQINYELKLIEQLRYEAYFLTVHDLVWFARSKGILCQGRGSAANSAVCYCLGVTSVDPAQVDVLFERFISAARNEPPDIDIDFEHERREEVIQYVYQKYGRERAGMTAEVITYRGRSAVRDVGKAMGLGLDLVDEMAKKLDWWDRGVLTKERLREVGLDPEDRTIRLVIDRTSELIGFPRHLSQHVGGLVMTRGPLCEMVPIENATMADRTVIEWDKDDIDAVGMLKVDVLALGMLTCISKAFQLVNNELTAENAEIAETRKRKNRNGFSASSAVSAVQNPSTKLELHTVPQGDPVVYDMICDADTIGVFQIESRAQMTMLPRLRPRNFYDLVIEVAIVRPGPIQGNMVHPYLRRRNKEEAVTYPSQEIKSVLSKTLGVPLFQEQAMKLAMVGAGFTAGEADQLRRAMAAWKRNKSLELFRQRIVDGMMKNGYTRQFAEDCFMQIRGFGEYGFPESHAASFALLVYVSAWLKRHHPAAFAAALLNSQPMGFYAPAQIVGDARGHSVPVRPVDVNHSEWDCTLETKNTTTENTEITESTEKKINNGFSVFSVTSVVKNSPIQSWGVHGPVLRLGFRLIKGLSTNHVQRIVEARNRDGAFHSVEELHNRTSLPRHAIERLARADAFGSFDQSRRSALWNAMAISDDPAPLFDRVEPPAVHVQLPAMPLGQEVMTDYTTTGLSLKQHPMSLLREQLKRDRIITAGELNDLTPGRWVRVAGLVLIRQRPGTASGIVFETLEDETGVVNLIVRPQIYDRYRPAARHAGVLMAEGFVERQGQVIHVMTLRMRDLSHMLAGFQFASRDFH